MKVTLFLLFPYNWHRKRYIFGITYLYNPYKLRTLKLLRIEKKKSLKTLKRNFNESVTVFAPEYLLFPFFVYQQIKLSMDVILVDLHSAIYAQQMIIW